MQQHSGNGGRGACASDFLPPGFEFYYQQGQEAATEGSGVGTDGRMMKATLSISFVKLNNYFRYLILIHNYNYHWMYIPLNFAFSGPNHDDSVAMAASVELHGGGGGAEAGERQRLQRCRSAPSS